MANLSDDLSDREGTVTNLSDDEYRGEKIRLAELLLNKIIELIDAVIAEREKA